MYRLIICLMAALGCAPAMAQTFPSPTFLNIIVNGAATLNGGTLGGSYASAGATFNGGTFNSITLGGTIPGTATLSGTITIPSPGVIGATAPNAINGTTGTYTGNVTVGKTNGGNIVVCDNHVGPNDCDAVPLEFPTRAALVSFQPNVIGNMLTAHTSGFAVAGDGGGALYDWVATSTCTNDSTYCNIPSGGTWAAGGRWLLRVPTGGVDVRVNGAKCDGVTDDTAVINSLILRTSSLGGGIVVIPATGAATGPSGCLINSANLLMKAGVTLRGSVGPFVGTQGFTQAYNSTLLLNPSFTITTAAGSTLQDLVVWRSGLPLVAPNTEAVIAAVNQWNGETSVGVTLKTSAIVQRVRVIGFNAAYQMIGGGDAILRDVEFDAANGIDLSGTNAPNFIENAIANGWWTTGFGNRFGVHDATATAGIAGGYTNGDLVTATGGTCITQPKFTLTVVAGSITAMPVSDTGDCTVEPGGTTFTGGTGTGLHATINWQNVGYRPGIAFNDHDGGNGDYLSGFLFELYQTAVQVDNSSSISISYGVAEGPSPTMPWAATVGALTLHCATATFVNANFTAYSIPLQANAKTDQSGATCNTAVNVNRLGATTFIGGLTGAANPGLTANISVGAGATAVISGMRINSGTGGTANAIVGAGANVTFSNLIFDPLANLHPWLSADATAVINSCGGITDGNGTLASISYVDTCAKTLIATGAKAANYTVTTNDTATAFNNSGATGEVDFSLPAAAVGLNYCFSVDAAQILKVIANGTDKIAVGTSNSAAGGNITANAIFANVCLYSYKAAQWVARNQPTGTWTVN